MVLGGNYQNRIAGNQTGGDDSRQPINQSFMGIVKMNRVDGGKRGQNEHRLGEDCTPSDWGDRQYSGIQAAFDSSATRSVSSCVGSVVVSIQESASSMVRTAEIGYSSRILVSGQYCRIKSTTCCFI